MANLAIMTQSALKNWKLVQEVKRLFQLDVLAEQSEGVGDVDSRPTGESDLVHWWIFITSEEPVHGE